MFTFGNLLHKIALYSVQVLEKNDNNFEAQASLGLISSFKIFSCFLLLLLLLLLLFSISLISVWLKQWQRNAYRIVKILYAYENQFWNHQKISAEKSITRLVQAFTCLKSTMEKPKSGQILR